MYVLLVVKLAAKMWFFSRYFFKLENKSFNKIYDVKSVEMQEERRIESIEIPLNKRCNCILQLHVLYIHKCNANAIKKILS